MISNIGVLPNDYIIAAKKEKYKNDLQSSIIDIILLCFESDKIERVTNTILKIQNFACHKFNSFSKIFYVAI